MAKTLGVREEQAHRPASKILALASEAIVQQCCRFALVVACLLASELGKS
ncbi:MAG: hypothetical protein JKY97_03850 [Citromicrobium sp.]|nr:hypothetical protein [Citromicrobium sp.]